MNICLKSLLEICPTEENFFFPSPYLLFLFHVIKIGGICHTIFLYIVVSEQSLALNST